MAFPNHLRLLFARVVCLAAGLTSLIIYRWNVTSGRIRIRIFFYMYNALSLQITTCIVELLGQLASMYFGSTTPVPANLFVCVLLIIVDWSLAALTVCTTWGSFGILAVFISDDVFTRSVNVRAMAHCLLSLVAGAAAAVAAFLSCEIAKHRHRQAQE